MEQISFREKINALNTKIFMPLMALTFILFNTVINLYIGERMETIQNMLAVVILAVLAFWRISDIKDGLMPWLRQNILVICYFAVRAVSCVLSGFDYTVIRSIFFEAPHWNVQDHSGKQKRLLYKSLYSSGASVQRRKSDTLLF